MSYWRPFVWSLAAGFAAGVIEGVRRGIEARLDEEDRQAWMEQNPPPPPRLKTGGEAADSAPNVTASPADSVPSAAPSTAISAALSSPSEDPEENTPSSLREWWMPVCHGWEVEHDESKA